MYFVRGFSLNFLLKSFGVEGSSNSGFGGGVGGLVRGIVDTVEHYKWKGVPLAHTHAHTLAVFECDACLSHKILKKSISTLIFLYSLFFDIGDKLYATW